MTELIETITLWVIPGFLLLDLVVRQRHYHQF